MASTTEPYRIPAMRRGTYESPMAEKLQKEWEGKSGLLGWMETVDHKKPGRRPGLFHLAILSLLFLAWFHEAERLSSGASGSRRLPFGGGGALVIVPLSALLLAGCSEPPGLAAVTVAGGDPGRAPALMTAYGCGTCHRIPGVTGARGGVGPPLSGFAQRTYVAGVLANTPENLLYWIRYPQRVSPGNAMPDMDVTDEDARDMAAYLYTLR